MCFLENWSSLQGWPMNIKDALSILGCSAAANQDAIKAAYRKACIKYHPDRNPAGLEMMNTQKCGYKCG